VDDWEKGDIGNPFTYENNAGIVTETATVEHRYIDITSKVIADYTMQRDKTQYRIAFQIDTDWDDEYDFVDFITSNHVNPLKFPLAVFCFHEVSALEEHFIS